MLEAQEKAHGGQKVREASGTRTHRAAASRPVFPQAVHDSNN